MPGSSVLSKPLFSAVSQGARIPGAARYIGGVTDNLILITLLVKLGVVASVASVLARVRTFRRLFFAEHRRPGQTLALLAFFLVPLTLGVWIRTSVPNFLAADISFATMILLGLLVGPFWAMLGGIVLSGPALYHGEYLALPFNAALGLLAGFLGRVSRAGGDLVVHAVYRLEPLSLGAARSAQGRGLIASFCMLFLIVAAEACRDWLALEFPHKLFALLASKPWLQVLVWISAPIDVGHSAEGVECAAHRVEARRTETSFAGSAA